MPTSVAAVDRPDLPPLELSDRFRTEIAYFMSIPGEAGVPNLGPGEYWVPLASAQDWLAEGTIRVVSPLDSENKTEVELREEHETFLEWLVAHRVERVRLTS